MPPGGSASVPTPLVELRLFGAPSVRIRAGPEAVGVLAQPKRLALLAYLAAATPHGFHRRDTVVALFWPDADQEHARTALRKALHFLRGQVGPGVVVSRGDEEIGIPEETLWCDVREFGRALAEGRVPEALELYAGDLLPGLFVSDTPQFEQWLEDERARLRGQAVEAGWALAARHERNRDAESAARWARWAVALAPDDERAARRLIALLARLGDRAGAIRSYEKLAARLQREYEAEPSAETRQLADAVRDSRPEAAGPRTPSRFEPVSATDPKAKPADWLAARPSTRQYIAVFPFAVHGDGSAAYLHEGLVDLLSTNLDHAGALHSIDPHALLSRVAREAAGRLDPGRAGELAQQFGAELYLLGSVVGVGGHLRISAALHYRSPGEDSPRYLSVAGQSDRLFELVDDLTGKLLAELHRGPGARHTRLAAATTPSLPALKAYLAGEKAMRLGRYIEAVDAFQLAVEQDADFSLAWYRLAFFLSWPTLPQPTLSADITELALRHKGRLSPHDGMLLEALIASIQGAAEQAERLYQEILAIHPEDVEAWMGLGQTMCFHNQQQGRLVTESRTAFERALALDPDNATATMFLCYVAHQEGRFDESDDLLARAPVESDFVYPRLVQAFGRGDREKREQAMGFLSTAPDSVVYETARFVATLTHDFPAARRVARLLADPARPPEARGMSSILAALLDVTTGNWAAARRELTEAASRQPVAALEYRSLFAALSFLPEDPAELKEVQRALVEWDAAAALPGTHPYPAFDLHRGAHAVLRLYLLGKVCARLGDATALSYAEELDTISGNPDAVGLARDLAHSVRGHHAFWRNDPEAALEALERARMRPRQILSVLQSPFYIQSAERWLRAELLRKLDRGHEALRWYTSLAQASLYDQIYLAPGHLRCGQICEELGERDRAADHFARCIEVWGNCDAELRPAVAEARARLDTLRRPGRERDARTRLRIG